MKFWTSTINRDFRTTVPAGVLKFLKIKPGDKIYWLVTDDKRVFVMADKSLMPVAEKRTPLRG